MNSKICFDLHSRIKYKYTFSFVIHGDIKYYFISIRGLLIHFLIKIYFFSIPLFELTLLFFVIAKLYSPKLPLKNGEKNSELNKLKIAVDIGLKMPY